MNQFYENKVMELDSRLTELEKSQIEVTVLVKQFNDTSKELSSTMKSVEKTMIEMRMELKENGKDICSLSDKFDKLHIKVHDEEHLNLVDIREPQREAAKSSIKKALTNVGVGVISLYAIYELIVKIVGSLKAG